MEWPWRWPTNRDVWTPRGVTHTSQTRPDTLPFSQLGQSHRMRRIQPMVTRQGSRLLRQAKIGRAWGRYFCPKQGTCCSRSPASPNRSCASPGFDSNRPEMSCRRPPADDASITVCYFAKTGSQSRRHSALGKTVAAGCQDQRLVPTAVSPPLALSAGFKAVHILAESWACATAVCDAYLKCDGACWASARSRQCSEDKLE